MVAEDDVDEGAGVYGKEGHGGGDKRGTGGAYGSDFVGSRGVFLCRVLTQQTQQSAAKFLGRNGERRTTMAAAAAATTTRSAMTSRRSRREINCNSCNLIYVICNSCNCICHSKAAEGESPNAPASSSTAPHAFMIDPMLDNWWIAAIMLLSDPSGLSHRPSTVPAPLPVQLATIDAIRAPLPPSPQPMSLLTDMIDHPRFGPIDCCVTAGYRAGS